MRNWKADPIFSLFKLKLTKSDAESVVTVKSLCATRWTAQTSAIEAVLKDYSILMETMAKINSTTHDEYGLKAGGILSALEKFNTLFRPILGYNFFGTAEEVTEVLQAKNLTIQEAISSANWH